MRTCAHRILYGQSGPTTGRSENKDLDNCIENGGCWARGYSRMFSMGQRWPESLAGAGCDLDRSGLQVRRVERKKPPQTHRYTAREIPASSLCRWRKPVPGARAAVRTEAFLLPPLPQPAVPPPHPHPPLPRGSGDSAVGRGQRGAWSAAQTQ